MVTGSGDGLDVIAGRPILLDGLRAQDPDRAAVLFGRGEARVGIAHHRPQVGAYSPERESAVQQLAVGLGRGKSRPLEPPARVGPASVRIDAAESAGSQTNPTAFEEVRARAS